MIAEIGGVDRTTYLKVNSCRFSGDLNGRWTLSAQLEGGKTGYPGTRPVRGSAIEINDGLSPLAIYFAGNISRIVERHHPGTTALQFDVEARDYNHIPARRLVTAEYENQSLYDIVEHINTNFMNGEGITLGSVYNPSPAAPIIAEKLTFRYESVASCFNRLATITGYQWYIDFSKVLHFAEYKVAAAVAFTITDTSTNWRDFEVEISDEDYRNRQHERTEIAVAATAGSFSPTNPTESPITAFAGQTSFPTSGIVTEMRRITVDGVDKTFYNVPSGESIPGSGYDFYALVGGIGFFALGWGPAVGGEIVLCDYLGDWSMYSTGAGGVTSADPAAGVRVVTAEDAAAQTARAAIEGGSGIWEAIEEQRNISSAAALQAIAEGRIRQYAVDASHVRFTTDDGADLLPGQRIVVNRAMHGINATYLIERIEQDWVRARPDFFRTRVTCTTAEPYGQSSGFVEKLVETARIGPGGSAGGSSVTPGGGGGVAVIQERPKGLVNGTNTVFQLTYEPDPPESLRLTVSGLLMDPLVTADYTLSGNTITYTAGSQPKTGEEHVAWYFQKGVTPAGSGARFFDGSDDALNWGFHASLNIAGDMSAGMWIKVPADSINNGAILSGGGIWGSTSWPACSVAYAIIIQGSSNAWDLYIGHDSYPPGSNVLHRFNCNLTDNQWYYIGFSRNDTAKTYTVYVSTSTGSLVAVETWAYTTSPYAGTGGETMVGNRTGTGYSPGRATIAEHYIWNRALTLAEHQEAMRGQPPLSGLVLECMMAGASPEVDIIGALSGTLTGTTIVAGH